MVPCTKRRLGETETENNRALVAAFVREMLVERKVGRLEDFLNLDCFTQHSPRLEDGLDSLRAGASRSMDDPRLVYAWRHRVLAEGNFVLSVSEGEHEGVHTAFYDLFRVEDGRLAEHWDTIEAVAPASQWKHENGKF